MPVFLRIPGIQAPHSRRKGWIEVGSWQETSSRLEYAQVPGVEFLFELPFGKVVADLHVRLLRDPGLGDVRVSVETPKLPSVRFTITQTAITSVNIVPGGKARVQLSSPQRHDQRHLWNFTYVHEDRKAG